MNQLTTFILVMTGMCILFYVMGINTEMNPLLGIMLTPQSFSTWSIWVQIIAIVAGATALGAITLGVVFKNIEIAIYSGLYILLATQLFYFTTVVALVMKSSPIFGVLLLSPILVLGIWNLVEYIRGRD